jgi:hypothetical protein
MNPYRIELEIFQGKGGELRRENDKIVIPETLEREGICTWMYLGDGKQSYEVGRRFRYPQDAGKLCPWMLGSMHSTLQTLWYGGALPWKYTGTPYEKEIDLEGVTTDFIRCTDPTAAGIVMKIIRTKVR